MAWNPGDPVQVKVGSLWLDGNVDVCLKPGYYCVTITTAPLPTLAECGETHPHVPDSTPINAMMTVSDAPSAIGDAGGNRIFEKIRNPV